MEPFSQLPGETLGTLGQFLTLNDILALATSNKDFQKKILQPEINDQLANYFGFPYGLSLIELKRYEEMSPGARLNAAAKIGDLRLLKKAIEANELIQLEEISVTAWGKMIHQVWDKKIPQFPTPFNLNNALYYASQKGHKEIVEYIDEIASKETLDFDDSLTEASQNGYIEIVKYLVEKGANNLDGALYKAAEKGHKEIVEYLLSKGATYYNYVANIAVKNGYENIVDILIKKGANNFDEIMSFAASEGHEKIIQKMIDLGAKDFNRSLLIAAYHGNENIVVKMIELGANKFEEAYDYAKQEGYDIIADRIMQLYHV